MSADLCRTHLGCQERGIAFVRQKAGMLLLSGRNEGMGKSADGEIQQQHGKNHT
jgi:hypothetical protein